MLLINRFFFSFPKENLWSRKIYDIERNPWTKEKNIKKRERKDLGEFIKTHWKTIKVICQCVFFFSLKLTVTSWVDLVWDEKKNMAIKLFFVVE
jgi:hypothetical protein